MDGRMDEVKYSSTNLFTFEAVLGDAVGTSELAADEASKRAVKGYPAGFPLSEMREERARYVDGAEEVCVALLQEPLVAE